jgi:hypothetical protein
MVGGGVSRGHIAPVGTDRGVAARGSRGAVREGRGGGCRLELGNPSMRRRMRSVVE